MREKVEQGERERRERKIEREKEGGRRRKSKRQWDKE